IHMLFEEPFDWPDFYRNVDAFVAMAQTVDHDVSCIGIISEAWLYSGSPFSRFRALLQRLPYNVRMLVILNTDNDMNSLIDAFFQIYWRFGSRLCLVNSMDEALARVQQRVLV